jgi:hypothetical protein
MKIKQTIKPLKMCDRWNDEESTEVTLVAISEPLPLGNNYTLRHLVDAIKDTLSDDEFIDLYCSVADHVIISYNTAYGKGKEHLNQFDFGCFFKPYYDNI